VAAGTAFGAVVVEVIDGVDLRALIGSYRGSGSGSCHPAMRLGLLVHGDATGVFSSRKLERATYDSVAFCFIAANDHPGHDTVDPCAGVRVLVDRDHGFRWKMITQSGGT
jgi:hypothetical protein